MTCCYLVCSVLCVVPHKPCMIVLSQAFTPEVASLEMEAVLLCRDKDVQNHLKTFYDSLDTSPMHLTHTSGERHHGDGEPWGVWGWS